MRRPLHSLPAGVLNVVGSMYACCMFCGVLFCYMVRGLPTQHAAPGCYRLSLGRQQTPGLHNCCCCCCAPAAACELGLLQAHSLLLPTPHYHAHAGARSSVCPQVRHCWLCIHMQGLKEDIWQVPALLARPAAFPPTNPPTHLRACLPTHRRV